MQAEQLMVPVKPESHSHAVTERLPGIEIICSAHSSHAVAPGSPTNLPLGQSSHAAEPLRLLKLPAGQTEHTPPLGPEYPGTQRHASIDPLASAEAE